MYIAKFFSDRIEFLFYRNHERKTIEKNHAGLLVLLLLLD
jgi:hypothetical protein